MTAPPPQRTEWFARPQLVKCEWCPRSTNHGIEVTAAAAKGNFAARAT